MGEDNIITFPVTSDGEEMSMRDYFASQVMIGLMFRDSDNSPEMDAILSYLIADAMMEARKR